ncbi:MAG: hypothetical protein EZS28_044337, partial [Streblomastix strix]
MTDSETNFRGPPAPYMHEAPLKMDTLATGDTKSQIALIIPRLRLQQFPDVKKIQSLEKLIILTVTLEQQQWRGIITECGLVDAVSSLMFETVNPRIR